MTDDGRVISNFVVQALLDKDITIYGDGKQTRSFQYIDDLVEGMIRMMATEDHFTGPVNIGNPLCECELTEWKYAGTDEYAGETCGNLS